MNNQERQSNFEFLKIIAMVMIVAHHLVAKNALNVDTDIVGISFNKIFLQFIGNHAFIGNNLFFMCSAWFLIDRQAEIESFPQKQIKRIWSMEKSMLFYGIGLWLVLRITLGGGTSTLLLLGKSLFPMSTNLWWYPTCYTSFLLIQPFYQRGLDTLRRDELQKLIIVMVCIWSLSTIIPFFNYEPTSFLCFIMLYAIVYMMKHNEYPFLTKKSCCLVITVGYTVAGVSIIALDLIGTKFFLASQYACYFIRGNYRLLPMVISVALFALCRGWRVQSKIVNYTASLTFGIYLIHMYPPMMELLFEKQGAVFDLTRWYSRPLLPVYAIVAIIICFVGCAVIETGRSLLEWFIKEKICKARKKIC